MDNGMQNHQLCESLIDPNTANLYITFTQTYYYIKINQKSDCFEKKKWAEET